MSVNIQKQKALYIKKTYLCPRIFGGVFSTPEKALKRESGANPEQTRCCELRQKSLSNTFSTVSFRNGKDIQRWSKSEDLPE